MNHDSMHFSTFTVTVNRIHVNIQCCIINVSHFQHHHCKWKSLQKHPSSALAGKLKFSRSIRFPLTGLSRLLVRNPENESARERRRKINTRKTLVGVIVSSHPTNKHKRQLRICFGPNDSTFSDVAMSLNLSFIKRGSDFDFVSEYIESFSPLLSKAVHSEKRSSFSWKLNKLSVDATRAPFENWI